MELNPRFRYLKNVSVKLTDHEFNLRGLSKIKKAPEKIEDDKNNHESRLRAILEDFRQRILAKDDSEEAEILLSNLVLKGKRWTLKPHLLGTKDVVIQDLKNKLLDWNDQWKIYLKSIGNVHSFEVKQALPTTEVERRRLAEEVYNEFAARIDNSVLDLRDIVNILDAKDQKCIYLRLAEQYSSRIPTPDGNCGHCSVCVSRERGGECKDEGMTSSFAPTPRILRWGNRYEKEQELFENVYKAVLTKTKRGASHPEFLTKMAFGVRSPILNIIGLANMKAAGSLRHWNYDVSLTRRIPTHFTNYPCPPTCRTSMRHLNSS